MVRRRGERGFTLLELIIVVTMIGILASIAMPALMQMPRRAKESVLKTNLRAIREALEQHFGDQGRYPASLDELVPKYLKTVPVDPLTKSSSTWVLVFEEEEEDAPLFVPAEGEEAGPGIQDIHSGSSERALDGTKYADW
ncbi:MAG TPA: type II secretion system protein [Thermoanaerobaculia bacterium]|nr:type II secretion system protein [Thermoanaerobaculia bacterium]